MSVVIQTSPPWRGVISYHFFVQNIKCYEYFPKVQEFLVRGISNIMIISYLQCDFHYKKCFT